MENGGLKVKRAEIDTRKPFGSVKEAVSLFGDRVLAGEVYANKLKQMREDEGQLKLGNVAAELKETKQSLEKAKEQSMAMAHCLSSLQEELDNTKKELQLLKQRDNFLSSSRKQQQHQQPTTLLESDEDVKVVEADPMEFQKKRYVTFANPPDAAAHVVVPPPTAVAEKLERLSSLKREKNKIKKTLMPLISAVFSKKKGN